MKNIVFIFLIFISYSSFSQNQNGNGTNVAPNERGENKGYELGKRKVLFKPVPKYICNESGKVVVEVTVDRNGNTMGVVIDEKRTTNVAKCLLDQAKTAAMNTKWQASDDAPERQVGKIVYSFSLN